MIRSFKDKMKVKQEAYEAEQKVLAEQAELARIKKEEELAIREWEAKKAEEARLVAEELHLKQQKRLEEQERQDAITRRRVQEWETERQKQLIQTEQNRKLIAEEKERAIERQIARLSETPEPKQKRSIHEGMPISAPSNWQLTWQSFSTHPKIIDLPMSEKIRLFKVAQAKEIQPINQTAVLGGSLNPNYALSFSGDRSGATDSYATTTFNPDTYSLWNGFTISFWVRPDEEMNQKSVILGTRATDPVARFHFGLSGTGADNIGIGIGGNDVTGINNPMEIGKWYNWVVSYTGTQGANGERKLRLWINTDARMTSNNNTSWNNQDEATESYNHGIYFGGRNTEGSGYTNGFACALDEVAIYNTCIDSVGTFASEVYNGGTSYNHLTNTHASNLVGYWKFNEGNGTGITDHSGNGNHGTFAPISGQTTAFPIWEEIKGYE